MVSRHAFALSRKREAVQPKGHLRDIRQAETNAEAETTFDFFVETYGMKYDKAAAELVKDREVLLSFYDFPTELAQALASTSASRTLSRVLSPSCTTAPEKPKAAWTGKPVSPWPSG